MLCFFCKYIVIFCIKISIPLNSYTPLPLLDSEPNLLSGKILFVRNTSIAIEVTNFLFCQGCVQSNYGVNPEVEKDRRVAIQEKIQRKKESLSQQTTFSNVRTMSRHAMEVEQSLNKGTEKSMAFSHLLHSSQKCMS